MAEPTRVAPSSKGSEGEATLEVDLLDAADVDAAAGELWLAGATAIAERPGGADGAAGALTLVAGFDDDDTAVTAAARLAERWPARVVVVDDDAWLDAWKEWVRPMTVGRLLVVPAWLPAEPAPDQLALVLDPGRVFGSGTHPSTRLVLAALHDLVGDGERVLDVGCGSGVLSIGAALLGAGDVVGIDIDPAAAEQTMHNAATNGVADRVSASSTPVEEVPGRFDVVVANIGLGELRDMAAALTDRLAPHGTLVLSGLSAHQWQEAVAAYDRLEVVDVAHDDGWSAPVLRHR